MSNSASKLQSLYGHKPLVPKPLTSDCAAAVEVYAYSNMKITSYCVLARHLFGVSQLSHEQLNGHLRDLEKKVQCVQCGGNINIMTPRSLGNVYRLTHFKLS